MKKNFFLTFSCLIFVASAAFGQTVFGVKTNNKLYSKTTLESAWVLVPQSCCVIGVTQL